MPGAADNLSFSPLTRSGETDQLSGQLVDHRFAETNFVLNDASRLSGKPGRKVDFLVKPER